MKQLTRLGCGSLMLLAVGGAVAQSCGEGLSSEGSVFSGKTYKNRALLAGVSAADAYARALAFTMENGFTVVSSNAELGQITAAQSAMLAKGKQVPLTIVVREAEGGAQVSLSFQTAPAQLSPESAVASHFCKTFAAAADASAAKAGVAQPMAKPPVAMAAAPRPSGPHGVAQPTAAQRQALTALVDRTALPARVKDARAALAPVLQQWLERMACMNHYQAAKSLAEFAAPGSLLANRYTAGYPMSQMEYHDRNQCLDVLRIQGWQAPADNALRFELIYKAADSGEAATTKHEVVRQPDGNWLFNF